jgi:rfaE bifunctional protein kinase chain/domain
MHGYNKTKYSIFKKNNMETNYVRLFEQFDEFKIMVIGDAMIDEYVWGQISRISPEAPVPVVNFARREQRLGGAANVALNIQALGATPIFCSTIGNDERANILTTLLTNNGLSADGIIKNSSRITTSKTRIIAGSQHVLRIDEETTKPLHAALEQEFVENIKKIAEHQKINAIIFEDYDKGCITPAVIEQVTALAYARNIPTLVDPKRRNFNHYFGVSLFKPNYKEFCEGINADVNKNSYDEIFAVAKDFQQKMNIKYMLVTLSERGALLSDGNRYAAVPARVRNIVDVSGAGDTLISVAALCMAAGAELEDMVAIANLAGGCVCEQVGVVPINKKTLLEECLKNL